VARYKIIFKPAAQRDFGKLQRPVQKRIASKIEALGADPRPSGSLKLQGAADIYRVRVGSYRILYAVGDTERLVVIARIKHRGDVYENLP
jgi:mRNA interferase RelE/StbE